MKHDATTGFQDIKALPDFIEVSLWSYLPWVIATIFCALLLFQIIKKIRAKTKTQESNIYLDSQKNLERLLKQLREEEISLKVFSSESSLILRNVIEVFYSFPAKDLTNKEIKSKLSQTSVSSKLLGETIELLSSLEETVFSKKSVKTLTSNVSEQILKLTKEIQESTSIKIAKEGK